jgi:hypothetical protein
VTGTEVEVTAGQQLEQIARDTDLDRIARLGMWLAAAESGSTDPKAKGMAAALRIAYAESLGLPPHAGSEVHIINGNLATSAQLKRAQAFTQGYHVVPTEQTPQACTVEIIDRSTGKRLVATKPVTFTIEDAKRMGLLEKKGKTWHNNPAEMLFARASSRAITMYIPHVALGVLAIEDVGEVVDGEVVPFEDGD